MSKLKLNNIAKKSLNVALSAYREIGSKDPEALLNVIYKLHPNTIKNSIEPIIKRIFEDKDINNAQKKEETINKLIELEQRVSTTKGTIELTINELYIIEHALDVFNRIGLGQFYEIGRVWEKTLSNFNCYWKLRDTTFRELAFTIFSNGVGYGIGATELHTQAKDCYTIQKVIQNYIAKKEVHHITSVWWHEPLPIGSKAKTEVSD